MKLTINQMVTLKNILRSVLANGTVQVVFEKVDGSIRVLNATLSDAKIASVTGELPGSNDSKTRKTSAETLSVFEVDEGKWKSFRLEKLISANTVKLEEIVKLTPKE